MVTLICTVKNEQDSIRKLIESVIKQSRLPDEFIIVDGGSTDGTQDVVREYACKHRFICLISAAEANISVGRNLAVQSATHDVIACTDAGSRLDKNWLWNIIKPFEENSNIDVVSGFYLPDAKTVFEECIAELTFPKIEKINPERFLPSGRSVAFKKQAWEKVGGYPEWLGKAEDTLFDLNLRRAGCKFYFAKDAIAYWRPRKNLMEFYELMRSYSYWDGYAGLFFRRRFVYYSLYLLGSGLMLLGFIWQPLWLVLITGVFLYFSIPTFKIYRSVQSVKSFIIVPALMLARDFGNMLGYAQGVWRKIKHEQ
jgi:glycosyltransferase involved in cell wall biosynthesis